MNHIYIIKHIKKKILMFLVPLFCSQAVGPFVTSTYHRPTFHVAHVQRVAQLLQKIGPGRVLLVLLAVVVLLRHAGVVEPGVAQLAVAVRVAALAGRRGGRRPLWGAFGSGTAGGLWRRKGGRSR